MATLELRGVVKHFGTKTAVDNVSIKVRDGEFLSLLGPSGCGKSTLLNIVAGLLEADEGQILMDGVDVSRRPPKDRSVAMVFQDYALYPHMNVRENLAFPLKAINTPASEIDLKVKAAADTLGISELLANLPRALSGGQRQRVALGRAIVRHPNVFLMDEPLSNLDAKLRIQMRAELKLLSRRLKTTTIYVTHDQSEAMTLSDRVAVLHNGVLQQIGPPLEVYRRPTNTFVAGFMGTMPMNFLEGTLERGASGTTFRAGALSLDLGDLLWQPAREKSRPVILGVRPEDVSFKIAGETAAGWMMSVEIIEELGTDAYVHLRAGDTNLLARAASGTDLIGQDVRVDLDRLRIHIFDATTGESLNAEATSTQYATR